MCKMLVINYPLTLHKNPDDERPLLHCSKNQIYFKYLCLIHWELLTWEALMGMYPARNKIKLLEELVKSFGTCTCICLWTVSVNSWKMTSIQNGNSLVHNGCNKWQLLSLFLNLQIEYFGSKINKTWKTITVSKWFDKCPSCFTKGLATLRSLTGAND
jgi:hypothetical protein